MTTNLFPRLVHHLRAAVDRHGEAFCPCPWCGKESTPKNVHFSFSEKGAHCFSCNEGGSLQKLARAVGLDVERAYISPMPPIRIVEKPARLPEWIGHAQDYLDSYTSAPDVYDRWQAYKPLDPDTILAYRLGVGVLPKYASRCPHERLIVPLIAGGEIRGFRGRSLGCDCGKWLSASTHPNWTKFLFNGGCLVRDRETARARNLGFSNSGHARCETVFIVENPVDALLIEQQLGVYAVATLGVTVWRDDWTQSLAECKPAEIVIGYDKDLAGNYSSPELVAEWRAKNPHAKAAPIPNGVRLVNNLLAARLPASLFRWPESAPTKCDFGSVLVPTT